MKKYFNRPLIVVLFLCSNTAMPDAIGDLQTLDAARATIHNDNVYIGGVLDSAPSEFHEKTKGINEILSRVPLKRQATEEEAGVIIKSLIGNVLAHLENPDTERACYKFCFKVPNFFKSSLTLQQQRHFEVLNRLQNLVIYLYNFDGVGNQERNKSLLNDEFSFIQQNSIVKKALFFECFLNVYKSHTQGIASRVFHGIVDEEIYKSPIAKLKEFCPHVKTVRLKNYFEKDIKEYISAIHVVKLVRGTKEANQIAAFDKDNKIFSLDNALDNIISSLSEEELQNRQKDHEYSINACNHLYLEMKTNAQNRLMSSKEEHQYQLQKLRAELRKRGVAPKEDPIVPAIKETEPRPKFSSKAKFLEVFYVLGDGDELLEIKFKETTLDTKTHSNHRLKRPKCQLSSKYIF